MAIRTIVTRGFGNGTFLGTIKDVVLRGFSVGEISVPDVPGIGYRMSNNKLDSIMTDNKLDYRMKES